MINRKKQILIYKKLRQSLLLIVNFFFLNPVNLFVFKKIAELGYGSNLCLKYGFLPVPVHFYSAIPDVEELKQRKIWDKKSHLPGIDFNKKEQIALLKELGANFGDECEWPLDRTKDATSFYINNSSFGYGCAAGLYTIIRKFKPKNIIEIGSGNSSRIVRQALKKNDRSSQYTIIDPYPGKDIYHNKIKPNRLIKEKVELVDPIIFKKLKANDILFIDSSHSVKIGSDVNYLFLEVLPILNPGVIIHIHDINLPYEYPKEYAQNEYFRQFWTEQYLLQAFLACNNDYKVLLGMNYLMTDHLKVFKKAFKNYDSSIHKQVSGGFWIQRKVG